MQLKCVILALVPSLGLAAPTVNLGYSTYQGIGLPTVNEFLGMRYAAPPTGDARWRAPAAPTNTSGVQDALQVSSSMILE
jgi:acetylcholinesterase